MLNKLQASKKLFLLIIIMSAFITGIGSYGIFELKKMQQSTQTLYADRVFPLEQLTRSRYNYSFNILSTAQRVNDQDLSYSDGLRIINVAEKQIREDWDAYMQTYLTPQELVLAKQHIHLRQQSDFAIRQLKGLLKKDQAKLNDVFIYQELYPAVKPVISQINKLINLQVRVGGEIYAESKSAYHKALIKFLLLIIASLFIAITFSYYLVRNVRQLINELRSSKEKYQSLLAHAGDPVFVLNREGFFVEVNDSMCQLLGFNATELSTMHLSSLFTPEQLAIQPLQLDLLEKNKALLLEKKWLKKDGTTVEVEINTRVVAEIGYLAIARDITERIKVNEALRLSELKYRNIFENVQDVFYQTDLNGLILDVSPSVINHTGYTRKEVLGTIASNLYTKPGDRMQALEMIRKKGELKDHEVSFKSKDGREIIVSMNVRLINGLDGKPSHLDGSFRNITEKKNLEVLLAKSNSLARIGSWEIDIIEGTVYWSDVTKEIREVGADFSLDLNTGIEYFEKDFDRTSERKRVDECIAFGLPWDEELEILTFKGNPKWIRTIGQAEMVDGRCVRIFGSFQDIDVRKRAEVEAGRAIRDLEESEKRYSDLFQLSPLPMWVYDFETLKFLDVNRTATKHYGYSFKEFLNMSIRQIRPEDEISALEDAIKLTTSKKLNFFQGVFRHKKNNGEVISVEVKSNIIDFKGRKAKVVVVNDITERLLYLDAVEKQNIILREISWIQSHVVRAPLAKLMGLVSLLENRSMQDKEKQLYLVQSIKICAEELDGVIREITKKSDTQEKLTPLR